MPVSISDLEDFAPKGEFLSELIDVSADAVMQSDTGQTVHESEKVEQRRVFITMTAKMACLKGKGVVNTILGELDGVVTHRDFLDAMKRIEPLLRRVRARLSELQILVPSRDPLSTLQLRQPVTQKPVSVLQKLTRSEQIKESELALNFINHLFPHLAHKLDEVQKGAHETGAGVHRDDMDFANVTYGGPITPASRETSIERRIWNGVQLPNRSEYGPKLLKLSQQPEHLDKIITFEQLQTLLADDPSTPITLGAVKQGLNKIDHLFQDSDKPLPYDKVHGQGIRFSSRASVMPHQTKTAEPTEFVPNADFLDQPIRLSSKKEVPLSGKEFAIDDIKSLSLTENAAKILQYMMENTTGNIVKVADVIRELELSAAVAVQIAKIRDEINQALEGRTEKRIMVAGANIGFAVTQ